MSLLYNTWLNYELSDYLEQALRDRLVFGLVNERVQQRLLSESELSLKKAFEIAQGMEIAQKETYEMRSSISDSDRLLWKRGPPS